MKMNTNLTKEETEELNAAIQKYKKQHNIKNCGGCYVYLPSEKLVFHGKTQAEAYHKMLNRKVKIDGEAVSDEELAEFLDWSFVTGSKDFKMFKHLKESGYFDTNPITTKDLQKAMEAAIR